MNERINNIPSEAPSTFNWIFEESVESVGNPGEQNSDWLSDQDSDTNRHSEVEWKTDTASSTEAGKDESFEAHDDNASGLETASDEKSEEEDYPEENNDIEVDWETESDRRSETTEDSTQSCRRWEHWDSFINWLKSDLPVYWVTGKPGSGKSTLMKFIMSDSRTKDALKEWNKDTIIISHFFWKPGSTMQHSFKGLLCSLLCLILKNDKSISHSSLERMIKDKDRKESPSDWDQHELRDPLLLYRNHSPQPICILIDALDEISPEQDTFDTLHMLEALISPNIKLCVSSRPERLFRLHLQDKPSLKIHDLTEPDIEQYSKVSIRDSILLEPQGLKVTSLARRISYMSQGVFLWAVLVTRSLIRGINNGDSKEDIDRRLISTPRDLMDLYRDIVTRSAADRDIYQQSTSLIFNLVFVAKRIPMTLFEFMMATDGRLLDQYVVQQKSINVQDLETNRLRMVNTIESSCAGLLELNGFMRDRPDDSGGSDLDYLLSGLKMRPEFIHRSAEEFLLGTEEGSKLWESCPYSREELLIRRTKARLAWFELYASLNIHSGMVCRSILELINVLERWIEEASLPHEVLIFTLNLAQRMYERGSIVPPLPYRCDPLVLSRSHRGQISSYAACFDKIASAKENLRTLPDSDRHETAYCIFHNHCSKIPRWGNDGIMLLTPEVVQFMIDNGYSPNWPGISETNTCKFGSPWLQYLLALYQVLTNTYDILTSTQALEVLDTIHMFLKSGASLHSKFEVLLTWSGPGDRGSYAAMRLGALWVHHREASSLSFRAEYLVLEINAKVLLESILMQVHGVIPPIAVKAHDPFSSIRLPI